ncbi:hypothetical protein GQ55_5G533500 [Panicum hallii var. hallii]|uniref:Mitochondrial arginine transporter BAC2 n=1 Tax=Panicum hallii var. hallii TaxID=1504633 RepID=A0A2T7DT59_9POAL|nr:hypothetical protein GQ55_5G533500 [Panicum hallii var. hallii]
MKVTGKERMGPVPCPLLCFLWWRAEQKLCQDDPSADAEPAAGAARLVTGPAAWACTSSHRDGSICFSCPADAVTRATPAPTRKAKALPVLALGRFLGANPAARPQIPPATPFAAPASLSPPSSQAGRQPSPPPPPSPLPLPAVPDPPRAHQSSAFGYAVSVVSSFQGRRAFCSISIRPFTGAPSIRLAPSVRQDDPSDPSHRVRPLDGRWSCRRARPATAAMEFWPEFLATSGGREFVAGGVGGMAGVLAGHPLDTLRIRLQQPPPPVSPGIVDAPSRPPSGARLLRGILRAEGPAALYRGMAAPLASVAFQNAMVFQVYAILSRSLGQESSTSEPPSYSSVALAGVGTGALQTLILSPVELVKIRLQLEAAGHKHRRPGDHHGPVDMARDIFRREGLRGIYRGLTVTALRDAPAHGVYFWTYEYARERLHPGCRRGGGESLATMLVSGGIAGVASWVCCYPLDVVKSRLQASPAARYRGVVDCFRRSVREEGLPVLWRGLGTAVARAFVVNGAIFSAYELALRFLGSGNGQRMVMEEN